MGTAQQRAAGTMAALWLAVLLLLQQQTTCAATAPSLPLALALYGRTYDLAGQQQRLELPLGCPGAHQAVPPALGLLHRVHLPAAAAAQRCSGSLTTLTAAPQGNLVSLRSQIQAFAPTVAAAGGSPREADPAAAAELWFTFQLDLSNFDPGGSYVLQLDISCSAASDGGQAALAAQSAIVVHAVCQVAQSAAAQQPWQQLAGGLQRLVAHFAGGGGSSSSLQQQQQELSSQQPRTGGLMLPGDGDASSSGSSSRPAGALRRLLAEGDMVPVVLLPSTAGQAIVVDGYSGLARPINASSGLPACAADGASSGGGQETCLKDPVLKTRNSQILLTIQLGPGAQIPASVLPVSAVTVTGNASLLSVSRIDGQTMEARVGLGLGEQPVTVSVPQGALLTYGISNAASNTLTIIRDTTPPVPVITTPGSMRSTPSRQLSLSIEYGEQVLGADLFSLFSHSGARRIDAVLDVRAGRLDIAIYVLDSQEGQDLDFSVWVSPGAVRDLVGNPNTKGATMTIKYRPESAGLQGAAVAANVFLGSSLALCTTASYLSSRLLPYAPGVLGCGALSLVGYAQTFYFTGHLAAEWLPPSYKQVADTFGWTVGEIRLPWADSMPHMDPDYAFPAVPVVLTSTGQEVAAAQYPALTNADVEGGTPLVAVTGQLSDLGAGSLGTAQTAVLPGIPFLNPSEAQTVGGGGGGNAPAPSGDASIKTLAPAPSQGSGSSGKGSDGTGVEGTLSITEGEEAPMTSSSSSSSPPPPAGAGAGGEAPEQQGGAHSAPPLPMALLAGPPPPATMMQLKPPSPAGSGGAAPPAVAPAAALPPPSPLGGSPGWAAQPPPPPAGSDGGTQPPLPPFSGRWAQPPAPASLDAPHGPPPPPSSGGGGGKTPAASVPAPPAAWEAGSPPPPPFPAAPVAPTEAGGSPPPAPETDASAAPPPAPEDGTTAGSPPSPPSSDTDGTSPPPAPEAPATDDGSGDAPAPEGDSPPAPETDGAAAPGTDEGTPPAPESEDTGGDVPSPPSPPGDEGTVDATSTDDSPDSTSTDGGAEAPPAAEGAGGASAAEAPPTPEETTGDGSDGGTASTASVADKAGGGGKGDGSSPAPATKKKARGDAPPEAAAARRRRALAEAAPRRGRRSLFAAAGDVATAADMAAAASAHPAFEGVLYVVASRGLQYMSADGVPNLQDVLVSGSAVQRAYDVIDAAGDNGGLPRQYYYDRLARTAFWTALFAFLVMVCHLAVLGVMMWRHARIPNTLWFPRIEIIVCLSILPALAYGAAGLFNCSAGDIVLGAFLMALLPCSFLLASFYLLWRWLQRGLLNRRRAIFVLRRDPLAEQIAMRTPLASPTATPRQITPAAAAVAGAGVGGGGGASPGGASVSSVGCASSAGGSLPPSSAVQRASAKAGSFTGFVRSICGSRKLQGDWNGINLDSRFVYKYGPLFEVTYGQTMARRRATYDFDPARGKVDRGALVPLPEIATLSWRGRALLEPHHLRTPAQLLGVAKVVILGAAVSGVQAADSYYQCCLLILLYGCYAIYLLAVRPFNVAAVGGMELVTVITTITSCGCAMAVMDGRGSNNLTRSTVGSVMLVVQLLGFLVFIGATWWVSLRALWRALALRRRLRLKPSPSDKMAAAVMQVMAADANILARKYADRWMVRALGVGLHNRPVWRRETEDLRRLLRATALPKRKVGDVGSVVRSKAPLPGEYDDDSGMPPSVDLGHAGGSGSGSGGSPSSQGGASGDAFDAHMPNSAHQQQQRQYDGGDAVIAVHNANGARSPPRELAAQPGSQLHRQLSDPALLAAAAAADAQQRAPPRG